MSRRSRRRLNRDLKKQKNYVYKTLEDVASYESLYKAAKDSTKHVRWKASVQKFNINLFQNLYNLRQKILNKEDVRQGFIKFQINERGKVRDIQSVHFAERVVQKSVCNSVLIPKFGKTLIKENSASQKNKGTLYASQLLEFHIRDFLKQYHTGYILTVDFKKFFANILHEPIYDFYKQKIKDEDLRNLCISFVEAFDSGLGLGSETSQLNAILYVNQIDHFIKHNFKYYGRYMDDSYIISHDKEKLKEFTHLLFAKYKELGIKLNEKKTLIQKLNQPFTFLQTRYFVTCNKIIKKPNKTSMKRNRRKFKRMLSFVSSGMMSRQEFLISYQSFIGSMKRRNASRSIYKLGKELSI